MRARYKKVIQALAVGSVLGLSPAWAQQDAADIKTLLDLAANDSARDVVSLPGDQLGEILAGASQAEREALVAALDAEEVDALLAALALGGAAAAVIANTVSAVITTAPDATDRIIDVVLQNAPPVALPQIAAALYDVIDRVFAEMAPPVFDGHVQAALAFDARIASRLVALGNTWDMADATRLARVLVALAEGDDTTLASTIETALALEGGQMLQLAAQFRDELPVAAVPEAPPPVPPVAVAPPAPIGGGAASPAGLAATGPARDAIFFASGQGGAGLAAGPSFTPVAAAVDVSPTD